MWKEFSEQNWTEQKTNGLYYGEVRDGEFNVGGCTIVDQLGFVNICRPCNGFFFNSYLHILFKHDNGAGRGRILLPTKL
jgi:hypothetical protein